MRMLLGMSQRNNADVDRKGGTYAGQGSAFQSGVWFQVYRVKLLYWYWMLVLEVLECIQVLLLNVSTWSTVYIWGVHWSWVPEVLDCLHPSVFNRIVVLEDGAPASGDDARVDVTPREGKGRVGTSACLHYAKVRMRQGVPRQHTCRRNQQAR